MTQSLFSIRNVEEARLALRANPGILDLKNPTAGALGALNTSVICDIVRTVRRIQDERPQYDRQHNRQYAQPRPPQQRPQQQPPQQPMPTAISATIGDLPPDPALIMDKVVEFSQCEVNYLKIGIFGPKYLETCLGALQQHAKEISLVAVLFADRFEHFEGPCELLAHAGFAGVMLDTADKQSGGLRQLLKRDTLRNFVQKAHQMSLFCGLAGSLKKEDVIPLLELKPDYLGFRTALCANQQRNATLSETALDELAKMFIRADRTA